jgi:hypothetical protein
MALFVTNPRTNAGRPKVGLVAAAKGISRKQAAQLRKKNYEAFQAAFEAAGGESAIKRRKRKAGSKARASTKSTKSTAKGAKNTFMSRAAAAVRAGQYPSMKAAMKAMKGSAGTKAAAAGGRRRDARGRFLNPGVAVVSGTLDTVGNVVDRIPLIGGFVGPLVAPLGVGALAAGAHYALVRAALPYVPDQVFAYVNPIKFTITGAAAATTITFVPVLAARDRQVVAAAVLTVGAALDLYTFLSTRFGSVQDPFGAGTADTVSLEGLAAQYSGLAAQYSGLATSDVDLVSEYSDAAGGDAAYCGADFSAAEGQALLSGMDSWCGAFGRPARSTGRVLTGRSRHAGLPGHRWGWLIRAIGFDKAQQIAALPPRERVKVIASLKEACVKAAEQEIAQLSVDGFGAPGAYGPPGAHAAPGAFGAVVYQGEGL